MKQIKVINRRVLVKEHAESKKKTESGLFIPDTVRMTDNTGLQKHITTGTVLSKGAKATFCQENDSILFARQDACEAEFNDEKHYLILDPQVVLKFNAEGITEINTDRVLIDVDPMEKITKSGIIIPASANYEPTTGTAIRVGSDCMEIKEGSRVLFGKAAGQDVEFQGKKYLSIREADITANIL